jgi:prepilin signal peptidase PulO-like enzyme (type II secretory pathway)
MFASLFWMPCVSDFLNLRIERNKVIPMYEVVFSMMLVAIGASIGSFLNVVEYRLPLMIEGESTDQKLNLSFPGSHCPGCKTPIRLKHNMPIVSWLMLKGRCSTCKTAIPRQYVVNEILGAMSMAIPLLILGLNINGITNGFSALLTYVGVSTLLAAYQGYRKRQQAS